MLWKHTSSLQYTTLSPANRCVLCAESDILGVIAASATLTLSEDRSCDVKVLLGADLGT